LAKDRPTEVVVAPERTGGNKNKTIAGAIISFIEACIEILKKKS
jgi:hypothetical protein